MSVALRVCITVYVQELPSFTYDTFGVKNNFIENILYLNALRNCITNHENIDNFYII